MLSESQTLLSSTIAQAKLESIANRWITNLREAIVREDAKAFAKCLQPQGWFRDLLTFSWDFKSIQGHNAIAHYLSKTNGLSVNARKISNLRLDDAPEGCPRLGRLGDKKMVEVALRFETPRAQGKGYAMIPYDAESHYAEDEEEQREIDTPRAFTLLLMISDWKGHEEVGYESGIYDGHNLSWEEVRTERREAIEKNPQVIVIGAGQTGLHVAARFRQMNIKALVLERNSRIGDNWRLRYPTLALHTPRKHHSLLYQPYPSTWPKFTPKDKLAFWLEQYAESQDLIVWLNSTLEPGPKYDNDARRWTVTVNRNGERIDMQPIHVVVDTGIFGDPRIPVFPGQEEFKGIISHSNAFAGGAPYKGKRVAVVGAGNSSADLCQDLVFRGASSVTMIQRSETSVASANIMAMHLDAVFAEGRPQEYVDLAAQSVPINALRELNRKMMPLFREIDKDMRKGLQKAGFKLTDGPDQSGQLLLVYDRGGGYFIDVGCASLIINGAVKVKQGSGIQRLTTNSIIFEDGSELIVDAIILATGWHPVRDAFRKLFGNEMIDRTEEIWGVDEDGEIRCGYKPTGQPGLWFAAGSFDFSRFYSKQLALYIKAQELGYLH